jgi:hypothetical protein
MANKIYASVLTLGLAIAPAVRAQTYPTGKDPRNGLKAGMYNAGVASKGMRLVSFSKKPAEFDTIKGLTFINSDLAFRGNYVYQGNFSGFSIWDISNPAKPVRVSVVPCVTSQGDPSIYGNLLFISAEGGGNRNDCAKGGVQNAKDHMAGVRIFDVSNPAAPKLIKNVQTCKGSHTHTVIPSPTDKNIIYLYVSGSQAARPDSELAGCKNGTDAADETNSMFRLDVIKVPLNNPTAAEVVTGARIFTDLAPAPRAVGRPARGGGGGRRGGRGADSAGRTAADTTPPPPIGPRNCHDVTSYPAMNLLAGACGSYGLLVDVSNPEKPVRLSAATDTNFSLWHTAVFSNDGSKVVFTDEWGGGTSPNCQASSMMQMGGNAILTIDRNKKYTEHSYFKIPSAQSAQENCVSHNGGLIPVPGRDLMVQGWYQGGIDVSDFTDPDHPFEVAYFDRGSVDPPPPPPSGDSAKGVELPAGAGRGAARSRGTIGGSWGAYYYNGYIYSSELARGFDILELRPSANLSANEIAAAKLVRMSEYNPQSQPKIVWPAAFPVVRSYLDQLVRGKGLSAARTTAISKALASAEKQTGAARAKTLSTLATQVEADENGAKDATRVKAMAEAIKALADVSK